LPARTGRQKVDWTSPPEGIDATMGGKRVGLQRSPIRLAAVLQKFVFDSAELLEPAAQTASVNGRSHRHLRRTVVCTTPNRAYQSQNFICTYLALTWQPFESSLSENAEITGGAEGDRTLDLRIANATLSQLSYRPTRGRRF